MKQCVPFVVSFGLILSASISLANDSPIVTATLPDRYLVGRAPEGVGRAARPQTTQQAPAPSPVERQQSTRSVERPQISTLNTNLTVIAPTFNGTDGQTISFVRFFNGTTQSATTHVAVVGNRTGRIYGQAAITAPRYASPQFSLNQILEFANVEPGFTGDDDGYSLYLEDPANRGNNGYQHVIYNSRNAFLENASMCTYLNDERYEGINQILINVHTSALPLWPAFVYIHNYNATPLDYVVTVTDARDGLLLGEIRLQQLAKNSTYQVPFSFFEQALGWTPRPNQEHANLIFRGDPEYHAIVGQMIYNQQFGSYVNMSHFCAINHHSAEETP